MHTSSVAGAEEMARMETGTAEQRDNPNQKTTHNRTHSLGQALVGCSFENMGTFMKQLNEHGEVCVRKQVGLQSHADK